MDFLFSLFFYLFVNKLVPDKKFNDDSLQYIILDELDGHAKETE